MKVQFSKCRENAQLPVRSTAKSTGWDVFVAESRLICPGEVTDLPTGLIAIAPYGHYFELCLRSSTPKKFNGLIIPHGFGIIDNDYCGPKDEMMVRVRNVGPNDIAVLEGTKIAQLILKEVIEFEMEEVSYEEVKRRASRGGFGSTGG